ncbi:MAG: hypothetical protein K2Y24_08985, partial [Pseudomonadaceae bacterium]|nr:hypothetical protein [Pseudomonadaceae bacterium]
DALVSGISDRKIVEVRVFSWAPNSKKPSLARFFIAYRKLTTSVSNTPIMCSTAHWVRPKLKP